MKILLTIASILICFAMMLSCSLDLSERPQTNESFTSSSSSSSTGAVTSITFPHGSTYPPPPQPINFDSIEAAIAYVQREDYSEYDEEEQIAYQHMNSVLMEDGYLYQVLHDSATFNTGRGISLYPQVKYEDVGICYWYEYQGKHFYVLVYHIREGEEYAIDLETEDFVDYYMKRFTTSDENRAEMKTEHPLFKTLVSWSQEEEIGKKQINFYCMIDDSHYIRIRSDAEKSVFADFVEGIVLNKVNIE